MWMVSGTACDINFEQYPGPSTVTARGGKEGREKGRKKGT